MALEWLVGPPAIKRFSNRVTDAPALAKWQAILAPLIPPPMMTTSLGLFMLSSYSRYRAFFNLQRRIVRLPSTFQPLNIKPLYTKRAQGTFPCAPVTNIA